MVQLKEWLKIYIPGKYPSHLLDNLKPSFKKAGIDFPEQFLKNLNYYTFYIAIMLAIGSHILFLIRGPNSPLIPTSMISNPIPLHLRPIVYPILAYILTPPLLYPFLLKLSLNGKISSRRDNIEANLHNLLVALLGFARAKLHLKDIVREISFMNIGEISKEFAKIYYAVHYGNKTLKIAILDSAENSPSQKFAQLLRGIVGVVEAGGDLARYIEDRIQSMEVEKKVEQNQYVKKLEMMAEIYLTITIALPTVFISTNLAKSIVGEMDPMTVYFVIYGVLPVSGALILFLIHMLSPEKTYTSRGASWLAIIPLCGVIGFLIGFIFQRNIEFWALAFTTVGCFVAYFAVSKYYKEEERIIEQLPIYLNRVLALVEAGKDVITSLKQAAFEVPYPLSKYVRVFAEMLDKGVQRNKAFKWLHDRTPSVDVKMVSKVLSTAVEIGGNIAPTLLSIVTEITRINSYRVERRSSAKTYAILLILSALMFIGIAVELSVSLLTQFEKVATTTPQSTGGAGGITISLSPYVINQTRTLLRHAIYIVCIVSALGIAGFEGDYRKIPLPLAVLLSLALAVSVGFLYLAP